MTNSFCYYTQQQLNSLEPCNSSTVLCIVQFNQHETKTIRSQLPSNSNSTVSHTQSVHSLYIVYRTVSLTMMHYAMSDRPFLLNMSTICCWPSALRMSQNLGSSLSSRRSKISSSLFTLSASMLCPCVQYIDRSTKTLNSTSQCANCSVKST